MSETRTTLNDIIAKHGQPNFLIGVGYIKDFVNNLERKISILENSCIKKQEKIDLLKSKLIETNSSMDTGVDVEVSRFLDNLNL